jgi:serine protease Do
MRAAAHTSHSESMANVLSNFSNDLAAAVARASAGVVSVHGRPRIGTSGLVWRKGFILTSSEGIRTDDPVKVLFADGRSVDSHLRGRDPGTDLALLEADTGSVSPLEFTADNQLQAGQIVLAVGRTSNTGPIASLGILSGVSGEWKTWRGGKINPFVRLDVSVYPTSSGGAAVDASGSLIGLVSTGLSRSSVLAVTRSTIDRVAQQLHDKGYVARGFLGIALQPVALPRDLKQQLSSNQESGILLLGVEPEGPAGAAGLTVGDILLDANGRAITDPEILAEVLDNTAIGAAVRFRVARGGALREVEIHIGERPRRGK